MDAMNNQYVLRNEDNAVWTKLDEAIMIIATQENEEKVFKLNKTAAFLWEQCDGRKTVADLIQEVCRMYAVDEPRAREDTLAFIATMQGRQLLSVASQSK
jgi:hypothetical protein